jgi:hypothetical protein
MTTAAPLDGYRALDEAEVAERIAATGRACGSCSLCCRLLDVPEAGKPRSQWCPHCLPGRGGCAIYDERPHVCRRWACLWLTDSSFGDEWFPQACGIVASMVRDTDTGDPVIIFHIDPRTPEVWRRAPYYAAIRHIALCGLRDDTGVRFRTMVACGTRPQILVLSHSEVERSPGIVAEVGPDRFEFIRCENDEGARALHSRLRSIEKVINEVRSQSPDMAPELVLEHVLRRLCA